MPDEPKKPRRSGLELAGMCQQRLNVLKDARIVFEPVWDEIAQYCRPSKANLVYCRTETPGTQNVDVLFDSTAVYGLQTLANGQLSYMTPADSPWFSYDPPEELSDNDKVETWFQRCTEITQKALANSNFYSEIHELFFDDGGFGTAVMLVLPGKKSLLHFEDLDIGTYWLDTDDEGMVDTLYREFKLTARQAAQKFGEDKLSPKMKAALEQFRKDGKGDNMFTIGHAIFPREDSEREYGKIDGKNKPWASVYWVCGGSSEAHTISNEGYDEKPFFATRWQQWMDSAYGCSPGWMSVPDSRQLNFLTKCMDALGEVAAFPRFLYPSNIDKGDIDLRAGGMTVFDESMPGAVPKEWMTGGRYDIGKDREDVKKKSIERAFHVDLFNMFSQREGPQITATEAQEIASEKLIQFTPAFARKTTELLGPMLQRIFGIMLRAGKFPPPPEGVVIMTNEGPAIADPDINYNSKVALAIKGLQNVSFNRVMSVMMPLIELKPELADNIDLDKAIRDIARNDGLPADWMIPKEDVDKIRQARADAAAKAQEQANALAGAQAAKDLGGVKPDSVGAQALQVLPQAA